MSDINTKTGEVVQEYMVAYQRAQADFADLMKDIKVMRDRILLLEKEAQQKAHMAKSLLSSLPEDFAKGSVKDFAFVSKHFSHDSRNSVANEFIRKIMAEHGRRHLRSAELIKRPEVKEFGVDPKSIYNSLNYLAKSGELRRISRGRYLVVSSGVGIESSFVPPSMEDLDTD